MVNGKQEEAWYDWRKGPDLKNRVPAWKEKWKQAAESLKCQTEAFISIPVAKGLYVLYFQLPSVMSYWASNTHTPMGEAFYLELFKYQWFALVIFTFNEMYILTVWQQSNW